MISLKDYLYNCDKMVNDKSMHYLYGYKGEKITEQLNTSLRKQYPNVWTYSYLTKANQWIGDRAIDCSGFVQVNCGGDVEVGSWYMSEKWDSISINDIDNRELSGLIGWRSGHVVVLTGRVQNGLYEIMEASGQKTGLRKRWANINEFKKLLVNPLVDYNSHHYRIGWNKDDRGWWFSPDGETYLKDGYFKCKWSQGESWFMFDSEGYCVITDSNGVIVQPKGDFMS